MTSVMGSGEPTMEDLLALAKEVGLPARESKRVATTIRDACGDLLKRNNLIKTERALLPNSPLSNLLSMG